MPQQLIYTSAPRGIVAGRSGYCTVARSAQMREAVMLQLEKFCYYQHLSLSGGRERPISACRVVDIRGARFHVLSRIRDAGLDYTGRTNFIAHHLVFTPEEIRQFPPPPVILRDWPGWLTCWAKDPQLLEDEDWTAISALNARVLVPAQTWQQVTGDAANGYGLLEARAGASFRMDDQTDETVLDLFAESLALLEIRDPRRDVRATAWSYTFTTSMQEQDNPADFRWRCLHLDNPAASRLATPDCRPLSAVRVIKCTGEEAVFARTGRQAPQFMIEPPDVHIVEGEIARLTAKAEGVPRPAYQWFSVDRTERKQILAGETNPELLVSSPVLGISRYLVQAANGAGEAQSRVVRLSVDERAQPAPAGFNNPARATKGPMHQKPAEDIERQWQKIDAQYDQAAQKRPPYNTWLVGLTVLVVVLTIAFIASACLFGWLKYGNKPTGKSPGPKTTGEVGPGFAPANSPQTPLNPSANSPLAVKVASAPLLLSPATTPLDSRWKAESIGSSVHPRAPGYDRGTFVLAAPVGQIWPWQTNDAFFFVSQPASNDTSFIARFFMAGKIGRSRCGLMLRESDRADAPFVFIGCSETSVLWMQRTAGGAASTQENYVAANQPVYLRLVHQGANFSGDFSSDGKNWLPLCVHGQMDLNGPNYLLGFALCAGLDEKTIHADFDSVTINGIKQ